MRLREGGGLPLSNRNRARRIKTAVSVLTNNDLVFMCVRARVISTRVSTYQRRGELFVRSFLSGLLKVVQPAVLTVAPL